MTDEESINPFGSDKGLQSAPQNATALSDQSRAIQEVQAAMVIAKRFPRDQIAAMDRILQSCTRPTLAEAALYSYNRGGAEVTGPSIRLAETIAQGWGNFQFGIRELSQSDGESSVEAFAWDIETNTRQVKVFQVPHVRFKNEYANGKKTGRMVSTRLEDSRDIYELVANQGARRMRACILGIIPGDVVEAAQRQCEATLHTKADTSPDAIAKMVEAFADYGVTDEHIKKRIGNRLDAIRPAQVVQLRKIYNSLRDGMSKASDWFEIEDLPTQSAETIALNEKIKAAKNGSKAAAPAEPAPADPGTPIDDVDDLILKLKFADSLDTLETLADLIRIFTGADKKRAQAAYQARVEELKGAA